VFHRALALLRPSGHHAFFDRAEGFCLLNYAALAQKFFKEECDMSSMVFDPDLHPSNGNFALCHNVTEIHCTGESEGGKVFQGTGGHPETGWADPWYDAKKNNASLALESYGDQDLLHATKRLLTTSYNLCEKEPDVLIVSLGLDTAYGDPTNHGFTNVTPRAGESAAA